MTHLHHISSSSSSSLSIVFLYSHTQKLSISERRIKLSYDGGADDADVGSGGGTSTHSVHNTRC
jgi:hypothetical protein